MAKPLKTILKKETKDPSVESGYSPKGGDERKFVAKHVVAKHDDANGNKDDVFNASNIKPVDRYKEAHGYNPGQDASVYEEVEQIDEYTHEGAVRAASIAKAKGKVKKAQLLMRLAKALETNDETTARGIERELAGLSEEAELEEKTLTKAEMKKREEVAKAIKREHPNMPMGMKMAIATKTAKRVAEDIDVTLLSLYAQLDEENKEIMMQLIDEGRQDELYEFASVLED